VARVRESLTFHEGDVQSALALCALWVRQQQLAHGTADDALTAAVLAVPAKRVARTFGPGVLALVCAWWAGKQRPKSAVA